MKAANYWSLRVRYSQSSLLSVEATGALKKGVSQKDVKYGHQPCVYANKMHFESDLHTNGDFQNFCHLLVFLASCPQSF